MRIVIRPVMEPQHEIDISQRLVAAIAEELWCLYGGNDHLNWLEAETHLRQIVGETRTEAAMADARLASANGSAGARNGSAGARNGSARSLSAEPADTHDQGPRHRIKRRRLVASIHE